MNKPGKAGAHMMDRKIFLFSDDGADQSLVGGKGFSLIKMARGGFPVPAGMVLTVGFFDEWLAELNAREDLRLLATDGDDALQAKTSALQEAAGRLRLSEAQQSFLAEKIAALGLPADQLYSVRSSSPEEDMAGASFAGMYETYLGVTADKLQERIRDVFVSCIDYRVVAYKKQKGFDYTRYSIAVVVMAQIVSEVAGVAFSINPLNNCFDEIVINANFGVGESVVSGDTVPDQFVVDKIANQVISQKVGDKKIAIVIGPDGGTERLSSDRRPEATLSPDQVLELAAMVGRVEKYYGMPMDTEWAYADGSFHMLQARPITTYIPLHPDFQTEPGEQKKLYLDLTLIEQGIQRPLSVLGTDCFRLLANSMGLTAAGVALAEKPGDFMYAAGGRAYVNLSAEVLLEGQKGTAKEYEGLDSYAAQIIREVDMTPYKGKMSASGAIKTAKALFTVMFKSADTIHGVLKGKKHPEKLRQDIDAKGADLIRAIDELDAKGLPLADLAEQAMYKAAEFMVHVSIPSLVDAEAAKNGLKKLFAKELKDPELLARADQIDRGLPHNVTIDLNCRIYELMTLLTPEDLKSVETLEQRIRDRALPESFLAKWDEFIRLYGFRGPREVDVKTPRYQDDPGLVIEHMQNYSSLDADNSPQAILDRQSQAREAAREVLSQHLKDVKKFDKLYDVLVNLGGYREIHKYYLVYAGEKVRYRALEIGRGLVEAGRIDDVDDIFYLTVDQVRRVVDDVSTDVRAMVDGHKQYLSVAENIDHFPPVIDSRGKIIRPAPKQPGPGELAGDPVSAGKVRGVVKVINYVGEKPMAEGDILAAKAADPGWTPLFIKATGILLEVGGMLQHGSLIAREYGKPCIAGIENLTQQVKDGDQVEMDGSTGIIKLL
jgi:pyruvate,water dikinase